MVVWRREMHENQGDETAASAPTYHGAFIMTRGAESRGDRWGRGHWWLSCYASAWFRARTGSTAPPPVSSQ